MPCRKSGIFALRALMALLAALGCLLPRTGSAHDIPNDVKVQMFVKPSGATLRLLVRVPLAETSAMLVPSVALGSDQAGRYVLVVNGENVVEQRKVEVGPTVGEMTVIESGLKADDRVVTAGILRAVPGQKVDPQTKTAAN